MKEATARIKINKLLEAVGWRFFADSNGPANIRLEPSVTIKSTDLDVSVVRRNHDPCDTAVPSLMAHRQDLHHPVSLTENRFTCDASPVRAVRKGTEPMPARKRGRGRPPPIPLFNA